VGLVFQDWALFPHLTAARNVAYGLTRGEVSAGRVEATLEMVGLGHLADRYRTSCREVRLSGSPWPELSPPGRGFSCSTSPFRIWTPSSGSRSRSDVAGLMREVGMTSIFVTHDQEEAFVLGDRVAVMRQGRVVQVGSPSEVYETPPLPG